MSLIFRLVIGAWLFSIAAHAQSDTLTTKSGLQYIRLRAGIGEIIHKGQKIKVNYSGRFSNGKVFDSGKNFKFTLGEEGFIAAWDEAFGLMKKGEKGIFIAKPSLAYGNQALKNEDGEVIVPANSVLIFEVEVVEAK
jgi:peptidylprolyl isomerase